MEQFIEQFTVRLIIILLLLPFRLFWWAFKHDFGLLEKPPEKNKPHGFALPPSTSPVWDRELDGADSGRPFL